MSAKDQHFKDELAVSPSPRIYRRGYLFRKVNGDSSGNVSSFHDVKTMYNGFYDHDVFGIFADLHYSQWDHTYGTDFGFNSVFPNFSTNASDGVILDGWTSSVPAGISGTVQLVNPVNSTSVATRGVLNLICSNSPASTIVFTKSNIITDNSATTGNFTVEWQMKKKSAESSDSDKFSVQVKIGQFHVKVDMGRFNVFLSEIGGSTVTILNKLTNGPADDQGQYSTFRLIIDKQRSTKKAVLLIDGSEVGSLNKTVNNGSTSDNEIKFGYFAAPSAASSTFLSYIRYHNAAFFPVETPCVNTIPVGDINDTSSIDSTRVWTNLGSAASLNSETSYQLVGNRMQFELIANGAGDVIMRRSSDLSSNAIGNAVELEACTAGASAANGRLRLEMDDGTISTKLDLDHLGNSTVSDGIQLNGVTITGYHAQGFNDGFDNANKFRIVVKGNGAGNTTNTWLYINDVLVATQSNTTATGNNLVQMQMFQSTTTYRIRTIKIFNRPAFVTRTINQAYVAYLNGVDESVTRYYSSQVILNDLSTLIGTSISATISAITKASSAVVTTTSPHGMNVGMVVGFSGISGMAEMNGQFGTITAVTSNTLTVNINSTGFTTYTSGGMVTGNLKQLPSLQVVNKDLSWGDTGMTAVGNLQQRGQNSSFTNNAGSPSWAAITVPSGIAKRDPITAYKNYYFQIRIPFTSQANEVTFMRFHRQLDVSDYVTSWGTSTFERDFISRKINPGDLRIKLMNPDDDFEQLRKRPDLWIDAGWETWIGAHTDFGDIEYPDFVGTVEDMTFESNDPYVTLDVSNFIKVLREVSVGDSLRTPPFTQLDIYAGQTVFRQATVADTIDNRLFTLNSKYRINVKDVYVNNVVQSHSAVTVINDPPGGVYFNTAPSGTVTMDINPTPALASANAGTVMRSLLIKEGKLLLNLDVEDVSLTSFETNVAGITICNISLTDSGNNPIFLFDFIENLAIQSSGTIFIDPNSQGSIGFDLISNPKIDSETISDRNLDPTFHSCTTLTTHNPVENVINTADFTYNTGSLLDNFTYTNTRTISAYDSTSPLASKTLVSVFGLRGPSRKSLKNSSTFFNIQTQYDFLTSVIDINTVVDRNLSPYGYRPPVYVLNSVHPNIFIYSFRDVLFLMRNSTTTPDDTLEITRIEKNYDELTGSVQGFSNSFIQFPGGAGVTTMFASDDAVCVGGSTPSCVITQDKINNGTSILTASITAITKASSAVITTAADHGMSVNDNVTFSGVSGMTQINGLFGTITATTHNTLTVNINSTGFSTYTSGGTVTDDFNIFVAVDDISSSNKSFAGN